MSRIIDSVEINHRVDFPLLCNARGVRVAIEVGTDLGVFAKQFMERFSGEQLLCVDPYQAYDELPGLRTPDMLTATHALMPWHGRVRIVQATSSEAAKGFPEWLRDRIDFVYIDGCHTYEAASEDIATWWPLVSAQGMLAGHDYDPSHPGVVRAVDEFAEREGVTVRAVRGDRECSWYAYKTEPSVLRRFFWESGEVIV